MSFLYWQAMQQNMEPGVVITANNGSSLAPGDLSAIIAPAPNSNTTQIVNMDFGYHPGFKLGLGANFDYDRWDARGEYTWFHGSNFQSTNILNASNNKRIAAMFLAPGFVSVGANNGGFLQMTEMWDLKMDLVDATLGRWCFAGDKLALHPFFGARGAWIRQNLLVTYTNPLSIGQPTNDRTVSFAFETSRSWGIGPSIGLDADWLLGYGMRFFGTASADLLYTWYTLHMDQEEFNNVPADVLNDILGVVGLRADGLGHGSPATVTSSISDMKGLLYGAFDLGGPGSGGTFAQGLNTTQKRIAFLQPHAELELGFGWGSYFTDDRWHFDLSASYGFQVFWDQNMFRHFDDGFSQASSTLSNGNLYVHGLTATVRFDY